MLTMYMYIGVYGYMSIQIDDSGDGINQMAIYMEIGWVKESMFMPADSLPSHKSTHPHPIVWGGVGWGGVG